MTDVGPEARLRVLMAHNFYREPGGEDGVFRAETKLLEDHGHEVIPFTAHNDAIADIGKVALVRSTFWNADVYRRVRALIRERRPDVLHAHNTFPLLSPSLFAAARAERVPVVQTLHNFRLLCANGLLLRHGAVCERCVGRTIPWPAVTGRCYRGSAAQSAVAAGAAWYQRVRRARDDGDDVDVYVALTSFARDKFIAGGLPADRMVVKPNFVEDLWANDRPGETANHALFVGRLAPEKGIATMLAAWRDSAGLPPLRIIGDGPMRPDVVAAAAADPRIVWLGQQTPPQVQQAMRHAAVLLVPSLWYEGAPLVIVEAFAAGLPVIGSALGGPAAQIEAGLTGWLHQPGDPVGLAEMVHRCQADAAAMPGMRTRARQRYLDSYSAPVNYRMLLAIYARAGCRVRAPRPGRVAELAMRSS